MRYGYYSGTDECIQQKTGRLYIAAATVQTTMEMEEHFMNIGELNQKHGIRGVAGSRRGGGGGLAAVRVLGAAHGLIYLHGAACNSGVASGGGQGSSLDERA